VATTVSGRLERAVPAAFVLQLDGYFYFGMSLLILILLRFGKHGDFAS
jgi:hypothetical protein